MVPVYVPTYFPLLTGTSGKIIPQKVLKKKKDASQLSSKISTQKADDIWREEAAGEHLLEEKNLNSSVYTQLTPNRLQF